MSEEIKLRLQQAISPQPNGGGGGSWEQDRKLLADALAEIVRLREALIAIKHGGSLAYAKMTAREALDAGHAR